MKPFKGGPRPTLPEVKPPKWYGAPKNAAGKPADPSNPPDHTIADTHYYVGKGVAMIKPPEHPHIRPTKGEEEAAGKRPAATAITNIREETPPLHNIPPRGKSWEKEYDKAEKEIERKEATALLLARQERLEAIKEETLIRQTNRRLCMGFGAVGIGAINVMNSAVGEIQRRVRDEDKLKNLSLKELNQIIATAGSITNKAQQAVESMARAERYILRHPLEDGVSEDDDTEDMSPDDAKIILENLTKSLNSSMRIIKGKPEVVSEQKDEDDES